LLIEETLEKEGIYWVQRARSNWLKHGDKNTIFFPSDGFETEKEKYNKMSKI
jgi:hypothetical protein